MYCVKEDIPSKPSPSGWSSFQVMQHNGLIQDPPSMYADVQVHAVTRQHKVCITLLLVISRLLESQSQVSLRHRTNFLMMCCCRDSVYKNGWTDVFSGACVWDSESDRTVVAIHLHQVDKRGVVNTVCGANVICWLGVAVCDSVLGPSQLTRNS